MRVDCGVDPKTGEQLYDLHERRAQRGSLRRLFAIFRASQYAARLLRLGTAPLGAGAEMGIDSTVVVSKIQ